MNDDLQISFYIRMFLMCFNIFWYIHYIKIRFNTTQYKLLLIHIYVCENKKRYNNGYRETQSAIKCARATYGKISAPKSHKARFFLRGTFQRVHKFSPFNEILRKWIVTKYFKASLHYWSANTHFLRVDRGHAYLRGRSRKTTVCPHTYVPTCALQLESETQPSVLTPLALFSSPSDLRASSHDREYKEKMKLIRGKRCTPRHVSRRHTQEWLD